MSAGGESERAGQPGGSGAGRPGQRAGRRAGGARGIRWGVDDAIAGAVGAVLLVLAADWALGRGLVADPRLAELLGYLAVWVPLGGAVLWACHRRGSGSLARDFGLRFRPLDLLWGLTIGLLARVVASLIEIAGYGRLGTGAATFDTSAGADAGGAGASAAAVADAAVPGSPAWWAWVLVSAVGLLWLVFALLAPVVIAPVIEEVFFRGLLLRAVERATDAPRPLALGVAALVSAAVFALLHVVDAGSGTVALVLGAGTFVFGLAAASVTAATGRLGAAIVAHIVFNALVVVPGLLG